MTCTVTGILRSPDGTPVASARLIIAAADIIASDDGAALPLVVTATTGEDGSLTIGLLPGRYSLTWVGRGHPYTVPLSVPDEPAAALEDLLVAAPVPVRGPRGAGWTSGYFDYGTGRVVFVSADGLGFETPDLRGAGAALPPGTEGQLLGYGPGGVPEATDPIVPLKTAQW